MKRSIGKRICAAVIMSVFMMSSVSVAFATQPSDESNRISFEELPQDYQEFIEPDAKIWKAADGSLIIVQDHPVMNYDSFPSRSSSIYAPQGGTLFDFADPWISSISYVRYQTFVPEERVALYLAFDSTKWTEILDIFMGEALDAIGDKAQERALQDLRRELVDAGLDVTLRQWKHGLAGLMLLGR